MSKGVTHFLILVFFILFSSWFFTSIYALYTYIRPAKIIGSKTPADYGLEYEAVQLKTSDGLKLAAWFLPGQENKGTIILGHGYPADKSDLIDYAKFLVEGGYNVLMFDWRYFGQSEGKYTTLGYNERKDVLAAVDYLKSRVDADALKIGAFGFSFSGANFIVTKSPDIKAIVADSTHIGLDKMAERVFVNFGPLKGLFIWPTGMLAKIFLGVNINEVDTLAAVKDLEVPIFFIHGKLDSQIPYQDSEALFQAASGSKELWLVEGAEHGLTRAFGGKEYEERILNFFDKYLK
jgi:fermentation-respiration switch protein FrsA (DUF1100 family)